MAASLPEFSGELDFEVEPARLFEVLTDLEQMSATIPDCASRQRVDERTMRCVVRPGFSFLRGTMNLTMTIVDLKPPTEATLGVDARGIGVAMQVESRLRISPRDGGSHLHWQGRVTKMSGLISSVSQGLVRAAAEQIVRQTWDGVRKHLDELPS